MLDHNQFHWLNSKEVINCVYAYLWTELAETIANVKKEYHGTGKSKHRKIHPEINQGYWLHGSIVTMEDKKNTPLKRQNLLYFTEFQT